MSTRLKAQILWDVGNAKSFGDLASAPRGSVDRVSRARLSRLRGRYCSSRANEV
jgi:hypothetical protein